MPILSKENNKTYFNHGLNPFVEKPILFFQMSFSIVLKDQSESDSDDENNQTVIEKKLVDNKKDEEKMETEEATKGDGKEVKTEREQPVQGQDSER